MAILFLLSIAVLQHHISLFLALLFVFKFEYKKFKRKNRQLLNRKRYTLWGIYIQGEKNAVLYSRISEKV